MQTSAKILETAIFASQSLGAADTLTSTLSARIAVIAEVAAFALT